MQDRFIKLKHNNKIYKIKNINSQSALKIILDIFLFAKQNRINNIIIYPSNKKMLFVVLGAKIAGIKNIFMSLQNTLYGKKSLTIYKIKIIAYSGKEFIGNFSLFCRNIRCRNYMQI